MVNALLWMEDTLRTGKMLPLSEDCFDRLKALEYSWARDGCLFTQAVTVQRRHEEATGQPGCHVSTVAQPAVGSGGRDHLYSDARSPTHQDRSAIGLTC